MMIRRLLEHFVGLSLYGGFVGLMVNVVGVGTVIYDFAIGPLAQAFLSWVTIPEKKRNTLETLTVKP